MKISCIHPECFKLPVDTMSRQELIDTLMWNSGGTGMSIMPVAYMVVQSFNSRKYKSLLAVSTPQEQWTDEELRQLVRIHEFVTAEYLRLFTIIDGGANFHCLSRSEHDGKVNYSYKKITFHHGYPYDSLQIVLDNLIKNDEQKFGKRKRLVS